MSSRRLRQEFPDLVGLPKQPPLLRLILRRLGQRRTVNRATPVHQAAEPPGLTSPDADPPTGSALPDPLRGTTHVTSSLKAGALRTRTVAVADWVHGSHTSPGRKLLHTRNCTWPGWRHPIRATHIAMPSSPNAASTRNHSLWTPARNSLLWASPSIPK